MTAPSSKELGETEDPKELVPGNVEQIEANVTRLTSEHTRISGRFDSLKAVRVPDWTGVAQESWEVSYDAEVERWKKYLKHIEETRDAIKTYSGSVTAAQTKAQQAIDKWNKGEAATKQAVTDYNEAVDNYNEHVCDPIPVNGPPVIRPAHPGVFVDPGQSIRDEAEEILDGARDDLETAGEDAVGKLQNVDGAKTEAQYDFWGVDADFEGPKAKWPWSKETEDDLEFGTSRARARGSSVSGPAPSVRGSSTRTRPGRTTTARSARMPSTAPWSASRATTRPRSTTPAGHAGGELFGGAKLTGDGGRRPGPARWQRRRRGLGRSRHRRRPGLRLGQGQVHRRRPRWHRLGPRWQGRWRLHRRRTRAARNRRRHHRLHRRIPLVNATLPIPVQFELPGPDWAPVDPAASGIENAAFVAARTPMTPGYTPTLVISGDERYDDASLRDIAEEAAALLTRETPHLKLLHREEVGSEKAPAVTQLIGAGIEVDGQRLDLGAAPGAHRGPRRGRPAQAGGGDLQGHLPGAGLAADRPRVPGLHADGAAGAGPARPVGS